MNLEQKIEALARQFHTVYQEEAKRQGDVRHHDDYDQLPENIKDFDRALARYVLTTFATELKAEVLEEVERGLPKEAEIIQTCSDWNAGYETGFNEALRDIRSLLQILKPL